jgi:hypothetical protein
VLGRHVKAVLKTATGFPREIDLSSRPVTDRTLLRLTRLLDQTTSLNLSGCRKITDAGLVHLGNCVHLRELKLADLSIDGKGLKCLANMAVLKHLNLALCNMLTDEGLEHVGRLRKLHSLDLASTGVTGPGLQSIRSLTELRVLNLFNLPVTDVDLGRALSQMTRLEHLYLGGTKVTDGGVDRVRRRLPKIKIHR